MAYRFSKRIVGLIIAGCLAVCHAKEELAVSPGNATYYVDPVHGDDTQAGTSKDVAWKSLAKINALRLAAGDQVVIASGTHATSLKPSGEGTAAHPIVIRFLPGVHTFVVEGALRRPYYISNSSGKFTRNTAVLISLLKLQPITIRCSGFWGNTKSAQLIYPK